MALPTQSLPTIGQPNSTEGPKERAVLAELQQILTQTGGGLSGDNLSLALAQILGVSDSLATRRGKSIIATTETRTNAAFGLMPTPDRVQNVVLPTDGLICVAYHATWQESVTGAARAAIFIGANQLVGGRSDAAGPTVGTAQASLGSGSTINRDTLLGSHPGGLASWQAIGTGVAAPAAYAGDATTGQVIGGGNIAGEVWATGAGVAVPGWGPCYIFAAAGTYDISVQFNASSGNVVAKNRKLWVETKAFG